MVLQLVEFRDRRDSALRWATKNPVLEQGEHGYERDTGKFKIGNGILRWLDLPYFVPQSNTDATAVQEALDNHVNSPTPHAVYDEIPSLTILFENGLA